MKGLLIESAPRDVFGQMALDEALAQERSDSFGVRFFRWDGVGATFGYSQRIGEVERELPGELREFCTRRPTGGGIVPHVDDLTFSCVFPSEGVLRPAEIYRRLHSALLGGLRAAGVAARLCARGRSAPSAAGRASQCFVEPVEMDVLSDDGKVLGGAIRRHGDTVLYQGSLQLAAARSRGEAYEQAMLDALAAEWGLRWERSDAPSSALDRADALEEKYRSTEWIRRR